MKSVERLSLLLMAGGTGFAWIIQYLYLAFLPTFPDWVYRFYAPAICIPAVVGGSLAYRRYAGFSKGAPLALTLLLVAGVIWTDATELKRGLYIAISFAMTLPMSAMIRKHDYLKPVIAAFGTGTAASLLLAMTQPMVPGRWGMLIHNGILLGNPASIGLQCATAVALLFLALSSLNPSRRLRSILMGLIPFLLICCILTASRTAFLALVGASCVGLLLRIRRNILLVIVVLVGVLLLWGTAMAAVAVFSDQPFYEQLLQRTIGSENETLMNLGGRTDIWYFGSDQFFEGMNWIAGVGTGGVDKTLGQLRTLGVGDLGPDGIRRLYAHNTLVWCGLGLGTLGLITGAAFTLSLIRNAYLLDKKENGYLRSSLIAFLLFFGSGAVVHLEPYWAMLGSVLWTVMSDSIGSKKGRRSPYRADIPVHLLRLPMAQQPCVVRKSPA